jgi:hypothetical protein
MALWWLVVAALGMTLSWSPSTVHSAEKGALDSLSFLLGDWKSDGGGKPGAAGGGFAFSRRLQNRVIVRTSHAGYPAQQGRPAYVHDDLMVLYATETGGIKADYYDSEGHVIRYAGTAAGGELRLTSEAEAGGPRFRLTYKLGPDGALAGRFEIAPPGKSDAFSPYLQWTARKVQSGPQARP